jgi:hypothetical protein
MFPSYLQSIEMIEDLQPARQEKSPAVVGGYLNCVFDRDMEIL